MKMAATFSVTVVQCTNTKGVIHITKGINRKYSRNKKIQMNIISQPKNVKAKMKHNGR